MNRLKNYTLSKSSFIRGRQCLKSLYLKKHHPELEDPITEVQQAIFDKGTNVGLLAHYLFPGGVDLGEFIPMEIEKVLSETSRLIGLGQDVIYEAGFCYNETLCFIDILVKKEGKWYACEVKGSTSVSEVYLWDAAFQYHVITSSGLELEDILIIHINNQYKKRGELNIHELFTAQSVLKEVQLMQGDIDKNINLMKQMLRTEIVPDVDIGKHCNDPYNCSFLGHCWARIPKYSVFNISRLSVDKKFDLYKQGILNINQIPDDYPLSESQRLQVYAEKSGESFIDTIQIRKFLKGFRFPIYFLDFETFQPAIPMFDKSRSYQQICFQYSLHILTGSDGGLIHKDFLAGIHGDPRIPFIEKLIEDLGTDGDIVVFNKSFEISRMKEIADDFPVHRKTIKSIISRIKDLMLPFQMKWYYTPDMMGSYSIKKVLPALVPEFSYENLEINKGDLASIAFERLYSEIDISITEKIRNDLLEYCKLDTLAMVEIFKVLQKE
jgi:predicted DNA-binding protein YlxM (UPF0122 family)